MLSQPIASAQFADGACRLVYEDAHGQYVMDDGGEPIYGVWFVPREELEAMFADQPIIVSSNNSAEA
ncbi:MAG TPA: hypothetical protein VKS79_14255 [Gemmataceae bacterium]|nr:hypothetical protein [Gemmataceae bacterium]